MCTDPEPPARKKLILDLDLDFFEPERPPATIIFEPGGPATVLEPGESIFEGARRIGVSIPTTCGGKGTCGRCRIRISDHSVPPSPVERRLLLKSEILAGIRLACRSRPAVDLTVTVEPEIPDRRR